MHLICNKHELLNGVNTVLKAVSSKSTMEILKCIYIEAHGTECVLVGNDLDIGIESKIKAQIIKNGNIAIDARIFSEIVKKLPDSDVEIIVDEHLLVTIKCEKSEFNISGQSGIEFTKLPEIIRSKPLILKQSILKEMIHRTIFSIALDEIRPILTGELFEIKDNILSIVSVDGFRVSNRNYVLEENFDDVKVVIPGKTLSEIQKILDADEASEVAIYFNDKHVLFEIENSIIVSRLLDGDFPKYEQILSIDHDTEIIVNRKQFQDSIERAALIAKDSNKNPITFQIEDGIIHISSITEIGKVHDELAVKQEGSDLRISFNPKYIIDIIKYIEDEDIYLYFTTPRNPCIIKSLENNNYRYLSLPIRTAD